MKTRCYDGKKWQYKFKYEGKGCCKKGFKTEREANSAGLNKLNELRSGFNTDNYITLGEYLKNWTRACKQPVVKGNTYRHYRNASQHTQKYKTGKMELSKINRRVYQKFTNDYSKEYVKETIRETDSAIRPALDDALYDGLTSKNPAYKVNYKAGEPTKSEQEKFISVTECGVLKDHVRKKGAHSSLALFIMICMGCRISSAGSIKTEHIDQVKNTIFINERRTDIPPRYISIAKSDMRHIMGVINTFAINYDGYIFKEVGSTINLHAINGALKSTYRVNNILIITLHALRRTHYSYLLAKGVSTHYTSKRLGYRNIAITASAYSHLLEKKFNKEDKKTTKTLENM